MSTCIYRNIKGEGHSDSTFSNFFSLETAGPIKAKFHVEPPWDGGTKDCSNGPPYPYMVKTLKIFFSGTKRPMTLKVGMQHWILEYYQVC